MKHAETVHPYLQIKLYKLFIQTEGKEKKKGCVYLQRRVSVTSLDTSNRASNDETVPSDTTIPLWSNSFELDILEPSLFEPFYVFFFLRKEHPHIGEKS